MHLRSLIATTAIALSAGATATLAQSADAADYLHSEILQCDSSPLYRNYDPVADNFGEPVEGVLYHRGDKIQVRDDDGHNYDQEGPRGVRVYMQHRWGYMSINCLPRP